MIFLYRLVAYLIYGGAFVYGRLRVHKDALWAGRLASKPIETADIWMHAASVGEVRVISHLIDYLHESDPSLIVHLTVMTRAGYQTAQSVADGFVHVSFLPLDVPLLWKRMLNQIKPKIVVIAETEIWPNLIIALVKHGIPLVLVNGRLSGKAFGRYRAFRGLFQPLLTSYEHLFVKGEEDFGRFLQLGVSTTKMTLAGDMKFDAPLVERTDAQNRTTRLSLGVTDSQFLLVAGSTRTGEEIQLVEIYGELSPRFPQLRMVLVPRHIERSSEVLDIVRRAGFGTAIAGAEPPDQDRAILVVDKMGILIDLYAAADLAFVGGTLVDVGGHNLLEPVWAGTPVLFGPSVNNVRDASEYIVRHQFGGMIQDASELSREIELILTKGNRFIRKTRADLAHSTTAVVGNYIRERIEHA
jgi:3-deoxy-D-manno-octulosonic-acid transferase